MLFLGNKKPPPLTRFFHECSISTLSPFFPITISLYRLIALIRDTVYNNPERDGRWTIWINSATYHGGGFFLNPGTRRAVKFNGRVPRTQKIFLEPSRTAKILTKSDRTVNKITMLVGHPKRILNLL
jgi:hypothetical protein